MRACPFCAIEAIQCCMTAGDVVAIADAHPVANGHTLVLPRKHVNSIFDLTPVQLAEMWHVVALVREQLRVSLKPDGFNIGINDGKAAGQTLDHAHVHIIPRRNGDVSDPRGGIRWIIPDKANYWSR